MPGPFHRFTVSRSGRDSLRENDGTRSNALSRFEMGTVVHPRSPHTDALIRQILTVAGTALVAKGYASIGCAPCTSPVKPGEDPRAGRWRGSQKTECGIHFIGGKMVRTGASA